MKVIEGQYLRDILDQPAAIERTLGRLRQDAGLSALSRKRASRYVLTGMGSSYHALYPLLLALIQAGCVAHHVETSELIENQRELLAGDTMVIVLSQSGRSAETMLLMDLVGQATLVGVTNEPASPLAMRADIVIQLDAGEEATVSCKSYVASLMALETVCSALTSGLEFETLADVASLTENYLSRWTEHVAALACEFKDLKQLYLAGRGRSLAAVGTGGLIIKEATRIAAEGMSAPAFRHGPIEVVGSGVVVALFAGDTSSAVLNEKLADEIVSAGGWANLIGSKASFSPFRIPAANQQVTPVLEILPIQMATLALAALQGREAGNFAIASKVTTKP